MSQHPRTTLAAVLLFAFSIAVVALPRARARERLAPVSRAWLAAIGVTTAERPHDDEPPEPDEAAPAKHRYVVAAMGDSITDFRSHGGGYLRALQRMCPESQFDGYGVGGQRVGNMRARFDAEIFSAKAPRYTHVLVLGGVNDLLVGTMDDARLAQIEEDLSAMYASARAHGVAVVALTIPPWMGATPLQRRMDDALDDFMVGEARAGRVDHALDLRPLLACDESAGGPAVCLRYRRVPQDSVHWNLAGHEAVAEALAREVFADCE